MIDWQNTVETCMRDVRARRIVQDSDGNRYRVDFEPGSEAKIARFMEENAFRAMNKHGLQSMLIGELRTS